METSNARRTEDIALDLLKFVAAHTNLSKTTASVTAGFAGSSSTAKPEDQVNAVLDLYARCRQAVETPVK